jgi:hypothetical protein
VGSSSHPFHFAEDDVRLAMFRVSLGPFDGARGPREFAPNADLRPDAFAQSEAGGDGVDLSRLDTQGLRDAAGMFSFSAVSKP